MCDTRLFAFTLLSSSSQTSSLGLKSGTVLPLRDFNFAILFFFSKVSFDSSVHFFQSSAAHWSGVSLPSQAPFDYSDVLVMVFLLQLDLPDVQVSSSHLKLRYGTTVCSSVGCKESRSVGTPAPIGSTNAQALIDLHCCRWA